MFSLNGGREREKTHTHARKAKSETVIEKKDIKRVYKNSQEEKQRAEIERVCVCVCGG